MPYVISIGRCSLLASTCLTKIGICLVPRPQYFTMVNRFGSSLSEICHQNQLIMKAYEKAVQTLDKIGITHTPVRQEE